jgi:hypothetical protein
VMSGENDGEEEYGNGFRRRSASYCERMHFTWMFKCPALRLTHMESVVNGRGRWSGASRNGSAQMMEASRV